MFNEIIKIYNGVPWKAKEPFIKKLQAIEGYATINKDMFKIISYRGLSTSRLTGEYVGHVVPSWEFYDYVMGFSDALERKLAQNAAKYPIKKSRGSEKKYTHL